MARLQILVLPTTKVGDVSQSDFLLVIDEAQAEVVAALHQSTINAKEVTGARGVLVFEHRIDVIQTWDHISPDD